jgi:tetratricopeptide (TPR) repeat protein
MACYSDRHSNLSIGCSFEKLEPQEQQFVVRVTYLLKGAMQIARRLQRLAGISLLVILALSVYWSLRLAVADWLGRSNSERRILRAINLSPEDAALRALRALPGSSERVQALKDALTLNHYWSEGWVELGLQYELSGKIHSAEYCLSKAAEVDKTYLPRWTLANYYFRRQDWPKFWIWAKRTSEMAYRDQSALFDLCWRATQDPEVVLTQGIVPNKKLLAQYVSFLLRTGRLEAAPTAAQKLLALASAEELPPLLACCDNLLAAGRFSKAEQIWDGLAQRRLIPYPPLQPQTGQSLTNGDFRAVPLSHGFDWRLTPPTGVLLARADAPRSLRITFTGDQPERFTLLWQLVPLLPSSPYELTTCYRIDGAPAKAGLYWQVADALTSSRILAASGDLASAGWAHNILRFQTTPTTQGACLRLVYSRPPGTVRIEGSLYLAQVRLRLVK